MALFGMSVTGLRLTHMMFGIGVLAACYALLLQCRVARWLAVLTCVALALEPAFVFAFRTQSYITMAPAALLIPAVAALLLAGETVGRARDRWLFGAGALAGFACWGYFVYALFVPVLLIASLRLQGPSPARLANVGWMALGLSAGGALYLLGYGLIAHNLGGISRVWDHVTSVQPGLGIAGSPAPLSERVAHAVEMVEMVLSGGWHRSLMFADDVRPGSELAKTGTLAIVPVIAWLVAEARGCATWATRLLMGLVVSFVAATTLFGTRLGGHHFMPVVPLLYMTTTIAVASLLAHTRSRAARALAGAGLVALATFNVTVDERDFNTLRRTGGVGTFSDAMNRLGEDLLADEHRRLLIFPDWGLFMPVVFLTHGRHDVLTDENAATAKRALCQGQDVSVGFITGDRPARFESLRAHLEWSAPTIVDYRQRNGDIVIQLGTFSGRRDGPGCASQ